jgi:hypothetical protein
MFLQPGEESNQPIAYGPGLPAPLGGQLTSGDNDGLIDFGPLFGQELVRILKYDGLMTEIVFWQDHMEMENPA